MKIIVPISGFGERFCRAGYKVPKPLVEIDGKPIVAHVVDMFAGKSDFIFICNQEHLNESVYRMEAILKEHCLWVARWIGYGLTALPTFLLVRKMQED